MFRQPLAALFLGVALVTGVFATAPTAHAGGIEDQYNEIRTQGLIFANLCNETQFPDGDSAVCACKIYGKCSLEQVLQMFVNVSYLVLALSGSAALVAFIYGGFEWILSAGYPERVDRGKKAITGAAIGIVIVFGAYSFINLLISILITGEPATTTLEETLDTTMINTE